METAKRIKQRREELGVSAEELAKRIGKAKTTIYRYELGYIEKMPTDVLKAISEVLRTTPAYLMGWSDDPNGNSEPSNIYPVDRIVTFDELGTVRAGYGGCIDEIPTGKKVDIPVSMLKGRPSTDFFTLRVRGNSMYPKLIDGDTILCLRCDSVDMHWIQLVSHLFIYMAAVRQVKFLRWFQQFHGDEFHWMKKTFLDI